MNPQMLRELMTPACPLGTADSLILDWVDDHTIFRVKQTGRFYVDVIPMLVNHRVCTTYVDSPYEYERFWCYNGTSQGAWCAAVIAAAMWDGSDDTEPLGWNKNGQTQEYRDPGRPDTWQTSKAVRFFEGMIEGAAEAGPGASDPR